MTETIHVASLSKRLTPEEVLLSNAYLRFGKGYTEVHRTPNGSMRITNNWRIRKHVR